MFKTVEKEIVCLDKSIYANAVYTDDGISVIVAGGDRSHIGAVSVVDSLGTQSTTTFPNHKETIIAEEWAKRIYGLFYQPVVVSAGVHYDNISEEGIGKVLSAAEALLKELCDVL